MIHAWVRLDAPLTFEGGVQLHVGSGPNYVYAASAWTWLAAVTWTELTIDLTQTQASVANFLASDIRQIGVQFDTGDGPEGGAFVGPVDAVFHIDNITAQ